MPEEQVVTETMPIDDCMKILGFGKLTDFNTESVLSLFEMTHWVLSENEELDKLPTAIEAKNILIRHLVTEQLKVRRYFQIVSPFENSCIHCRGAGELFKFVKKTVEVNCHICGGKGDLKIPCPTCKGKVKTKQVECPTCQGSGRYIRRWPEGGGINVSCRRCKGKTTIEEEIVCERCNNEKTIVVKCAECRGKGKKKKFPLDHNIKSTTPCPVCGQLGFTQNVKPKKIPKPKTKRYEPSNPVIPQDLAGAIRAHIKQ